VPPLSPPFCPRCGKPLDARPGRGGLCQPCRSGDLQALDWARAVYPFTGPVREAIHRFKYGRERARAAHLGQPVVALLDQLPSSDDYRLLPVPLSAERRRERGYNQAEELARVLAAATGWPLETALARTRATRPQVGLDRAARHRNVRGAFTWQGASLAGARLILVDDVLTTGATADACAAVLKAAGADWVGLVTVARAVDRAGYEGL
jgi:ComF family protein